MLSPRQGFSATVNDTKTNLTITGDQNSDASSADSMKAITAMNSDGKLDVQIVPFSNTSTVTGNGTMKVGDATVKLTVKQTPNGFNIVDGDMFVPLEITAQQVLTNGTKVAIDNF